MRGTSDNHNSRLNQRLRVYSLSNSVESGLLNERILLLVFNSIEWDIEALCRTASVNRRLRALAKRLLWKELCLSRAPRMVSTLTERAFNSSIGGGWNSLGKLLYFCCGCESTRHFEMSQPSPGHFVRSSRFSKTSGRSFLIKRCRNDLLYVSDPCEHETGNKDGDLGIYRGVFGRFLNSRTRECLVRRQVELEARVRCPYCGARVWSMTTAGLVPRSAARRLGSLDGRLDYFVCVNGHLHGTCWLVSLSSDQEDIDEVDEDFDSDDGGSYDENESVDDGEARHNDGSDHREVLDAYFDSSNSSSTSLVR